MADEINELIFDVDLDSLTKSLNKAQAAIEEAFTKSKGLSGFDSSITAISTNVEGLVTKMNRLTAGSEKFSQTTAEASRELNKLAASLDAVGEKSAALQAGALADMMKSAYVGLEQEINSYNAPRRGPAGQFMDRKSYQDYMQTNFAGAPNLDAALPGIKQELAAISAAELQANRNVTAEVNAMWDNTYSQMAIKAEAAAQKQVAAFNQTLLAEKTAATESQAQLQLIAQKVREGGNGPTNAWNLPVEGTNLQLKDFRTQLEQAGFSMKALDQAGRSMWERQIGLMGNHIVQWGGFIILLQSAMALIQGVESSIKEGVQTAGEFQQQMVQLRSLQAVGGSAGLNLGAATDGQVWDNASRLAIKYGDNINDVVQDLMMWYKTTGDLNNAVSITNESLKFQVATGTDLEDTYRTLTALQNQASGMKMGLGDNSTFDLGRTAEFLNKIYTSALVAGAGMNQLTKDGREMGTGMQNAGAILLHAMEQDTEALKSLGLSMSQAIAIDQALITSMGNTGAGADSAAERISRLVGGFMELSRSAKAAAVMKDLGAESYKNLQALFDSNKSQGDILVGLITYWNSLDQTQKNALATSVAGNRQYQILLNLIDSVSGIYPKILKAQQDSAALNNAAKQMNDTFLLQVKQLQSEWQTVVTIIGTQLIPVIMGAIKLTAQWAAGVANVMAAATKGAALDASITAGGHAIPQEPHGPGWMGPLSSLGVAPWTANGYGQQRASSELGSVVSDIRAALYKMNPTNQPGQKQVFMVGMQGVLDRATDANTLLEQLAVTRPQGFGGGASVLDILTKNGLNPAYSQQPNVRAAELGYNVQHIDEEVKAAYDRSIAAGLGANSGAGGSPSPADPATKAGATRDAAQQDKTALDALTSSYHAYLDARKDSLSGDEAEITALNRKQQIYGQNTADMNAMKALYQDESASLTSTNSALQKYAKGFEDQIAAAQKSQKGTAANSQEYARWATVITRAQTELNSVNHAIQENNNALTENNYKIIEQQNALANTQYSKYMSQVVKDLNLAYKEYEVGQISLAQVEARRNQIIQGSSGYLSQFVAGTLEANNAQIKLGETLDGLNVRLEEFNSRMQKSTSDLIGKYQESLVSTMFDVQTRLSTPEQAAQIEYEKDMVDLKKKERDFDQEIGVLAVQAQGSDWSLQVSQIDRLGNSYFSAAESAAKLREQQTITLNSPAYHATQQLFDSIDSTVASTVTDSLFGVDKTNQQISSLTQELQVLNDQKTMEQEIYDSYSYHTQAQTVAHNERMLQIQQETKALEDQKQKLQDSISNPSVIKKLAMDFSKTLIDGFMKQLSDQALATIFRVKPDPALQQAFDNFHQYLKADFENPVTDFGNYVGGANASDYTFVGAVGNFGQYVQQFASSIPTAGGGGSDGGLSSGFWNAVNSLTPGSLDSGSGSTTGGYNFPVDGNAVKASGGGLGGFALPAALGLGAVAAAGIPAIASALRAPGVPTGGAGLPMNGSGSGINLGANWQSSATQGAIQDSLFLTAAPPGSGGLSDASWIQPLINSPLTMPQIGAAIAGGSFTGVGLPGSGNPNPFGQPGSPAWQAGQATKPPGSGGAGGWLSQLGPHGTTAGGSAFTGLWSSAGSLGKYMGIAGGLMGLYSSITGGGGFGNAVSAALSMASIAGWTGPVGIGLDALAFIAGLIGIGNHDNPANMPDKYDTQRYGTTMAELLGAGYQQKAPAGANGQSFTMDPQLAQMTGGLGMISFIEETLAKYGSKSSAPAWLQPIWDQMMKLFGSSSTGSGKLNWGHAINNEWITGAAGVDGQVHQYTDYLNAMNQFIQGYTSNLQNASQMTIVALNQFGSAVGFLPANWDTPGYDYANNPATGTGTGTGTTPPPTNPNPPPTNPGDPGDPGNKGGGGGKNENLKSAYSYSPSGGYSGGVTSGTITTVVNMDGRQVARSVQSYQLRTGRQGFQRIT